MKKVIIGLAVLLVVLGVVLWQIYSNLDTIVAKIIQDVGTEVTQTSVNVSDVQLELVEGKAGISGLAVANPAGFSNPNIFSLEQVAVAIDIESLKQNPIIINEVLVRQPQVYYEMNKDGTSNLDVLKKNVESYTASGKADTGADKETQDASKGKEIKLIIRTLRFDGGHLSASSALAPDKKIEADLPAFQMSNLGQSTGGATSDQIAKEVVSRLTRQAADAAAQAGVEKLKGDLMERGKKALDEKVGGKLKGLLGQ